MDDKTGEWLNPLSCPMRWNSVSSLQPDTALLCLGCINLYLCHRCRQLRAAQ